MRGNKYFYLMAAALMMVAASPAFAQIGIFDGSMDIDAGRLGAAGSAKFDANTGTYTITGSGHDIWDEADNFHFLYKKWSGDFDFSANASVEGGLETQAWIKIMLMARQDLTPGSVNVGTRIRRDGQFSMQRRPEPNAGGVSTAGDLRVVIPQGTAQRLVKRGNMFSTYFRNDEGKWQLIETVPCDIKGSYYVGFAVTAHDVGEIATGTASAVSLTRPSAAASVTMMFQDGVSPTAAYAGTKDAHIISWDGSQNQLGRNADGTNSGNGSEANYSNDPQNAGLHEYIEEGDYGGGSDDTKAILIAFDVSTIAAADAKKVSRAQIGLYHTHERSTGGNGSGPNNVAAGTINPHVINVQPLLKSWQEGTGGDVDAGSNVDGVDAPDNSGAVTWNSTGSQLWEAIGAEGPSDVGPVVSSTFFNAKPGQWVWLDVTGLARQWIANPASNNGVKISQETDNIPENPPLVYLKGAYNFVSSDNNQAALRPKLVIDLFGASNVGSEWSLYQ